MNSRLFSMVMIPSTWTTVETLLWIFRLMGGLTFLAWPGVFIASIMGAAAHVSIDTAWTNFTRFLYIASIGYPLYFFLLWKWADFLKINHPTLAVSLTALPVLLIYGAIALNESKSWLEDKKQKQMANSYQEIIVSGLQEKDYEKAFGMFLDESRSTQVAMLQSHSMDFNIREIVEDSLGSHPPSKELIDYTLRLLNPNITGIGINLLFRSKVKGKEYSLFGMSEEVLKLLQKWKNSGISVNDLPSERQWVWDHLDLYTEDGQYLILLKLEEENPLTAQLANRFETVEGYSKMIAEKPTELLNRRGTIFGTPLNALLLNYRLERSKNSVFRVKALLEAGAELHPEERTDINLKTLEEIRK
jgi:hypothetical protein